MELLVDSGATTLFIDKDFATKHGLKLNRIRKPQTVRTIDGSEITSGKIMSDTWVDVEIGRHKEGVRLKLVKLDGQDIVLGMPWLRQHNVKIDWKEGSVTFSSEYCKDQCLEERIAATAQATIIEKKEDKPSRVEEQVPEAYHEYLDLFRKELADGDLPPHRGEFDCNIELLEGKEPRNFHPYKCNPGNRESLKKEIEGNLKKGHIKVSRSPAAAPMFPVDKKDGTLRWVVDYRNLNTITWKDRHPIPLTNGIVDKLQGAKYFTKLDMRVGYSNVRIKEGDEWKTAFICELGLYEYTVMPFGLTNAPAVFQRLMNNLFKDLIDRGLLVYLDDLLIYGRTLDELRATTKEVLQRLKDHRFWVKPEKCSFEQIEVEMVGFHADGTHVRMDPHKTTAIQEWKAPTSIKQVQEFLGFANFYRRFIKGFSKIGRPLFDLLKGEKGKQRFQWTDKQAKSFEELKQCFEKGPVLIHPNPKKQYYMEVDASDFATGGELSQVAEDGKRHPIAFISKSLAPAERNYDIYDKELLAIIRAFQEWRHHLEGTKEMVVIMTDHNNLRYFMTTKTLTRRQARWAEFLASFNFEIQYRPGKNAGKPDALSRRPDHIPIDEPERRQRIFSPEQFVLARQIVHADNEQSIVGSIKDAMKNDARAQNVLRYLDTGGKNEKDFAKDGEFLRHKGKMYVPSDSDIKKRLLELYHDSKLAGHKGQKATMERISRYYWWPRMGDFVNRYVEGCDICQRVKTRTHAPYGELQPLGVPEKPWTDVSYDLITGLPDCEEKDAILNFVDRSTKQGHFIACRSDIDSKGVARLFVDWIIRLHGIPERIVSDRGTVFNSEFTKQWQRILGIKANLSTAYHPESDGQTERVNGIVEDYIRCFTSWRQDDWVELLSTAEFSYNNTVSESTGHTPFFLNHGQHPRFSPGTPDDDIIPAANELAENIRNAQEEANAMMKMAQERYKGQANKHRIKAPELKPGDKVWLSTKNIRTSRPSPKLEHRRIGPYKVIEKIGRLAY